jgi:hypothetical protein
MVKVLRSGGRAPRLPGAMRRIYPILIVAAISTATSACTCRGDPDRPVVAEEGGQRFLLCGKLVDDREDETIDAGGVKLKRHGFVVERQGEADGQARFGVISGVEEWNEPNRENLRELIQWFRGERVEAIIVAGGIGAEREGCFDVLSSLASSSLPVLPLIGASEDFAGYRRALAQVREQHPNVVDLTTARLIRWDGVDLVSLPGYHNPFYLAHRHGGCAYRAEDVDALGELLDQSRQPVLLVIAGPPRGRGPDAVDWARGGVNIGDPQLTKLMQGNRGREKIAFGVFGHVYEAGGNATSDVEGRSAVPPERWSKTLFLNPGAAEAVPYDLASGGRSRGMGAVLEIGPEGARYRLNVLPRLAAPEQEPRPDGGSGQPTGQNDAGPAAQDASTTPTTVP